LVYYTPQQHKEHIFFDGADYGILSLGWQSHSLWCLGYPDQALKQCLKAVNLSEVFAHPASQVMALVYLGILYQLRQETEEARMCGESCLSLVSHHTIGYYQEVASILRTWSLVCTNPDLDRVNDFRVALNQFRAIGGGIRWNYYFSLLAELYGRIGELQTGLKTLDKAFAVVAGNGEHWWDAEMYRLRGNLLLLQSNDSLAEADYQQAINLARDKAALSLEMRAAISLARLWQGQGRVMEAYELLSAVYNQFTEGFDTPDLKDAQALLADLTN
jgi:predicted ATPase